MKILAKDSNNFFVLASPTDKVSTGDYLLISEQDKKVILQVYDERYLSVEGMDEEFLREELISESLSGTSHEYASFSSLIIKLRDMRLLSCKVRSFISGENDSKLFSLPSRTRSRISILDYNKMISVLRKGTHKINIGKVSNEDFYINAESLDGRITLITGKKESGKSHLAKIILKGLLLHGCYCVVFDINGEYSFLLDDNDVSKKVLILTPGKNLCYSLMSAGLRAISSVLTHSLEIPATSLREFVKMWHYLDSQGKLRISEFFDLIERWRCNEFVRDALLSRLGSLVNSGLITDSDSYSQTFESGFNSKEGCCIIISMKEVSPLTRKMAVELILSKILELLERKEIPPVFLFAEEAHLYLRETYWEDLTTRMRHFGVFTVFITNQPDSIDKKIYRQIDNFFVYKLANDSDIELISQSSSLDFQSLAPILKSLPPRTCLALGDVVCNMPAIVKVTEKISSNSGATRLFFSDSLTI